jgi:hypothetical protein
LVVLYFLRLSAKNSALQAAERNCFDSPEQRRGEEVVSVPAILFLPNPSSFISVLSFLIVFSSTDTRISAPSKNLRPVKASVFLYQSCGVLVSLLVLVAVFASSFW